MYKYYVLHANHRQMDTDTSFKVITGIDCGGPQAHAELCMDLAFAGGYRTVASLEAESLAEAHRRTNNGDHLWFTQPDVKLQVMGSVRSTSIGDILLQQLTAPDGSASGTMHVVSQHGFTDITPYFSKGGKQAETPVSLRAKVKDARHGS